MPTRDEVAASVRQNLEDADVTYYSSEDVNNSIQDGYNRYAALSGGIFSTITFPKLASTYWDLASRIPDYMYLVGIYNISTNKWLIPKTRRYLDSIRSDWELWQGQPCYFSIVDFRRICVAPHLTTADGSVILIYKAKPPTLSGGLVLKIPNKVSNVIENYATADLLEQGKEYSKSQSYWAEWNKQISMARSLVINSANGDKLRVLEPYFPMGLYSPATGESDMHIDNETPSGSVNGVNTVFTLSATPNPAGSLQLCLNGLLLLEGTGYTLSGSSITMTTAPKAASEEDLQGDTLRAWYRIS